MIIEHKGKVISEDKTIAAISINVALLSTLLTATSLKLEPDSEGNHEQDQVIIKLGFGRLTFIGHEINSDSICKLNDVTWKPE